MDYNLPELEALLYDQEAGASSLLYRYITILNTILCTDPALDRQTQLNKLDELLIIVNEAHPLMAIFTNLHTFLKEGLHSRHKTLSQLLSEFKSQTNLNTQLTVSKASELFKGKKAIFTFSHSAIVRKTILEMQKDNSDIEVMITEARPVFEGIILAKVLAQSGIKVHLFTDVAMERALEKSDLVLIGTDWYWEDGFVNKIGTHMALRIAGENNIPVAVLSDSSKKMNKEPWNKSKDVHAASQILNVQTSGIEVYNPFFETMSYQGVTHMVVDGELRIF